MINNVDNDEFNKGYGKYYPEADSKEMVTQGQPVKLDGFGTFTPTIENDGMKAQTSIEASMNVGIEIDLLLNCLAVIINKV